MKAVASSITNTVGLRIATRATASSWRSPEERLPPRSRSSVSSPLGSLASSSLRPSSAQT